MKVAEKTAALTFTTSPVLASLVVLGLLGGCAKKAAPPPPPPAPQQPAQTQTPPPAPPAVDTAQPTASTITPGSVQDLINQVGTDRVFFGYDSADLDAAAQDTLKKETEWLQKNTTVKITIEGHCDERGTREYNLALGDRRAEAVKSYLANSGVGRARVTTISYGKERPEVVGSEETSYAKNRRGVTVIR